MHPVAPSHPLLSTLFDVPYLHFVVTAMGAGNSPALVWVDDTHRPTSALIWDQTHSVYFGGHADNPAFTAALPAFIGDTLMPMARQRNIELFKLYDTDEGWRSQMPTFFPSMDVETHPRVLYRLNPQATTHLHEHLPPRMHLQLIDGYLLQSHYPGMDALRQEIESCWVSLEHFVDQAFGYCIIHDTDGIVAWCTAEYVSPGICGVGIETVEPYQRQGLATCTAAAFAKHAIRLDWQVHWDSWLKNTPSIHTAEKVGFQKIADYAVGVVLLS